MLDLTARLLTWVLRACTPRPRGRHRAGALPALRIAPSSPPPHYCDHLDGSTSPLVRPYLLGDAGTHLERHRQRERRRALHLATLGIDAGPQYIHGMWVGAAR